MMSNIRKETRLNTLLERLAQLPACANGLEMFKQISTVLNDIEDQVFGTYAWSPPRTFRNGAKSERMYPTYPESMLAMPGYTGVTVLMHVKEIMLVSRFGALEVREKSVGLKDDLRTAMAGKMLLEKLDAYGHGVWHDKNAG